MLHGAMLPASCTGRAIMGFDAVWPEVSTSVPGNIGPLASLPLSRTTLYRRCDSMAIGRPVGVEGLGMEATSTLERRQAGLGTLSVGCCQGVVFSEQLIEQSRLVKTVDLQDPPKPGGVRTAPVIVNNQGVFGGNPQP